MGMAWGVEDEGVVLIVSFRTLDDLSFPAGEMEVVVS